jgi:hypothetical protein
MLPPPSGQQPDSFQINPVPSQTTSLGTSAAVIAGILGVAPSLHAADPASTAVVPPAVTENVMSFAEGVLNIPWQTWGEFGAVAGSAVALNYMLGRKIKSLEDLSGDRFSRDNLAAGGLRWIRRMIWGATTLVGMHILGVDFGNILLNFGIPAALIGWGLKDLTSNIAAYWGLVSRGHIDVGDYISVKDMAGYVRKIMPFGVVLESRAEDGSLKRLYIPCSTILTEVVKKMFVDKGVTSSIKVGHYVKIGSEISGRVVSLTDRGIGIEEEASDGTRFLKYVSMHQISPGSFKNYGLEPPRLPGGAGIESRLVLDGKRGKVASYNDRYVYLLDEDGTMMHRIPRTSFAGTWSYIDPSTRQFPDDQPEKLIYPPSNPIETSVFIELRKPAEVSSFTPRIGAGVESFADIATVAKIGSANMVEIRPDKFPEEEKLIRFTADGLGFEEVPQNMKRLAAILKKRYMTAQFHLPSEFGSVDGSSRVLSSGRLDDHDLLMKYFETLEALRKKHELSGELIVTVHPPYEVLSHDFRDIVARYELAEVVNHEQIAPRKKADIEARYLQNTNAFLVRLGRTIEEKGWKMKIGVENQPHSSKELWTVGDKMSDFETMMNGTSAAIQLTFDTAHTTSIFGTFGERRARSLIHFAMQHGKHIAGYQTRLPAGADGTSSIAKIPGFHRFHLKRCALEGACATFEVDLKDEGNKDGLARFFSKISNSMERLRERGR